MRDTTGVASRGPTTVDTTIASAWLVQTKLHAPRPRLTDALAGRPR
jgi:hypothetical protein